METSILYIIAGVVGLLLFVFIARRLLRLAIKLVLAGVVIVALLAGAGYGWWNGWFEKQTKPERKPGPTRTSSPR
jgi:VIT1/CCC1 family predicted Fe2+/Mn2+ transporter